LWIFFFQGLYNTALNAGEPICYTKTDTAKPDSNSCGADVIVENQVAKRFEGRHQTSWIVNAVQAAFDALVLPKGKLIGPLNIPTNTNGAIVINPPPGYHYNNGNGSIIIYRDHSPSNSLLIPFLTIIVSLFMLF